MKTKIILCLFFVSVAFQLSYSQKRQLKSTKVVFVVSEESNKIEAMELFEGEKSKMLIKKYPKCNFFFRSLKR